MKKLVTALSLIVLFTADNSSAQVDDNSSAQVDEHFCGGAKIWEGLCVREEIPQSGRKRPGYTKARHSADWELAIIPRLPYNLRETDGDRIVAFQTPYSCKRFTVKTNGHADTDIEHIVSLAEAHDSGLTTPFRTLFANDLDNLTVADKRINSQKSDRDAAEWTPLNNGVWFAHQVIKVKQKYGLSVDLEEARALWDLLRSGPLVLDCP